MSGDSRRKLIECGTELRKLRVQIKTNQFHFTVPYLISYSVIKSCGTIEQVYKDVIYNHLTKRANPESKAYFQKMIKENSSNPSNDNIIRMLKTINPAWVGRYKRAPLANEKMQLDSLVDLRNDFAHGYNITSTIENVIQYFSSSRKVLEFLNKMIK